MNIIDVIEKKSRNEILSYEELSLAFNGYVEGTVKDYQMSSLLMAILINGLNDDETVNLTDIFIKSGETIDFKEFGISADKHSTGGVGDKVTLIIGPIVASCNIKFPKMSGRGLGYTGGTIDKLESIPGLKLDLSKAEMKDAIKNVGMFIASQTDDFVPMDKQIYSLRSSSGTVASIDLIAISIMSKKIAYGADSIFLDVKCGNGAFMQNKEDAEELVRVMEVIAKHFDKKIVCEISDMNTPLGDAIGNALEVKEALDVLSGKKGYLTELCVDIAAEIVAVSKRIAFESAKEEVISVLESGKALAKFNEFVSNQGGNINDMKLASTVIPVMSNKSGVIKALDALKVAKVSFELGAGRLSKEESIDYGVGILLKCKIGDKVSFDDVLAEVYCNEKTIELDKVLDCFVIE